MSDLFHNLADRVLVWRVQLRVNALRFMRLLRKPVVFRQWLFSARGAQIALLMMLLLLPTLAPMAVDAVLQKLYPPVKEKHLFGLFNKINNDPRVEQRHGQWLVLLWSASGVAVLVLLFRHMPRSLREAAARAEAAEREADSLVHVEPSRSVLLYNSAIALTTDEECEAVLRGKLRSLDEELSLGAGLSGAGISSPSTTQKIECVGPGGRYQIIGDLGRGAMGVVYRAHDRRLGRDLALKQLAPHLSHDRGFFIRFQQEARALARLSHPNIVQVYDFLQEQSDAWIVMELVDGCELAEQLERSGVMALPQAARIAQQMAQAMDYAHERGVVHRDFKPANVLLTQEGEPKVMDFGMAKLAQSNSHTLVGTVLGSPAYMSPEQGGGEPATVLSDVYSFGITLYEMLTGAVPFNAQSAMAVIVMHASEAPQPPMALNAAIPEPLNDLILQMLAKDPAQRPQRMGDIARALEAFI